MAKTPELQTQKDFLISLYAIHPTLGAWAEVRIHQKGWTVERVKDELANLIIQSGRV